MSIKDIFKDYINNIGGNNAKLRDDWIAGKLKMASAGQKILDIGAGEGRYKKFTEHLEYVSQDFAQYDGQGDGSGLQTGAWDCSSIDIVSDILAIPVPDVSFDIILCTEVLEHVPNPRLAIKEMLRILKPGGRLIVTAPFCSLTHFAPYHFYTGFNKYFYEDVLKEYGCSIDELVPSGDWFDYVSQELRRLPAVVNLYTNGSINVFDKLIIGIALLRMRRYQGKQVDVNSSALLTYGYHLLATKNR
jgi:ubiquinone/menaquinone biosynthesis C-methylase UbiE